ncbi:MAG: hypothetical protein AB1632_03190 [Nitrospirota bacterium]
MKNREDKFNHELEVFRTEIDSAIQFFYAYVTMNAALAGNKDALDMVNRTPLFWKTVSGALQTSFFIALGRIFDQHQKSQHNIDKLIRIAQDNAIIFSKEELEVRARGRSANSSEWIDDFMKRAYVPRADDFRRLRRYVSKYRKIYEKVYRDIRHKLYAHKELSNPDDVKGLFAKTNIREIQKLLIFLNKLHFALWLLFHNGNKPVLRQMKYSVNRMRRREIPKWESTHIQEHMVNETEKFFKLLSSIPKRSL